VKLPHSLPNAEACCGTGAGAGAGEDTTTEGVTGSSMKSIREGASTATTTGAGDGVATDLFAPDTGTGLDTVPVPEAPFLEFRFERLRGASSSSSSSAAGLLSLLGGTVFAIYRLCSYLSRMNFSTTRTLSPSLGLYTFGGIFASYNSFARAFPHSSMNYKT
jgi:hypothetical protein